MKTPTLRRWQWLDAIASGGFWLLLALAPGIMTPLHAGQAAPETSTQPGATESSDTVIPDVCDWSLKGRPWQEQSQDLVRGMSCHTFRWFDGLFGKEHDFPEGEVNGFVRTGANWSQYEGLEGRLRVRVRAPLPNMSNRWDVLLGREDEQAFVADREIQDETFKNPGFVPREEAEWLLGLGHRRGSDRSGFDYSAGIRLRTPLLPYAKAQYLYSDSWGERTVMRFRQTAFWREDQGFGTTSRSDLSYTLDTTNVLRLEVVGTVSEEEREGLEWVVGQTWYHLFGNESALSLLSFVRGETEAEVELQEYGFSLIWRRPFTRQWLFLSIGPSVTWPRYYLHEDRDVSLGFGVWMEMEFGDYRY